MRGASCGCLRRIKGFDVRNTIPELIYTDAFFGVFRKDPGKNGIDFLRNKMFLVEIITTL